MVRQQETNQTQNQQPDSAQEEEMSPPKPPAAELDPRFARFAGFNKRISENQNGAHQAGRNNSRDDRNEAPRDERNGANNGRHERAPTREMSFAEYQRLKRGGGHENKMPVRERAKMPGHDRAEKTPEPERERADRMPVHERAEKMPTHERVNLKPHERTTLRSHERIAPKPHERVTLTPHRRATPEDLGRVSPSSVSPDSDVATSAASHAATTSTGFSSKDFQGFSAERAASMREVLTSNRQEIGNWDNEIEMMRPSEAMKSEIRSELKKSLGITDSGVEVDIARVRGEQFIQLTQTDREGVWTTHVGIDGRVIDIGQDRLAPHAKFTATRAEVERDFQSVIAKHQVDIAAWKDQAAVRQDYIHNQLRSSLRIAHSVETSIDVQAPNDNYRVVSLRDGDRVIASYVVGAVQETQTTGYFTHDKFDDYVLEGVRPVSGSSAYIANDVDFGQLSKRQISISSTEIKIGDATSISLKTDDGYTSTAVMYNGKGDNLIISVFKDGNHMADPGTEYQRLQVAGDGTVTALKSDPTLKSPLELDREGPNAAEHIGKATKLNEASELTKKLRADIISRYDAEFAAQVEAERAAIESEKFKKQQAEYEANVQFVENHIATEIKKDSPNYDTLVDFANQRDDALRKLSPENQQARGSLAAQLERQGVPQKVLDEMLVQWSREQALDDKSKMSVTSKFLGMVAASNEIERSKLEASAEVALSKRAQEGTFFYSEGTSPKKLQEIGVSLDLRPDGSLHISTPEGGKLTGAYKGDYKPELHYSPASTKSSADETMWRNGDIPHKVVTFEGSNNSTNIWIYGGYTKSDGTPSDVPTKTQSMVAYRINNETGDYTVTRIDDYGVRFHPEKQEVMRTRIEDRISYSNGLGPDDLKKAGISIGMTGAGELYVHSDAKTQRNIIQTFNKDAQDYIRKEVDNYVGWFQGSKVHQINVVKHEKGDVQVIVYGPYTNLDGSRAQGETAFQERYAYSVKPDGSAQVVIKYPVYPVKYKADGTKVEK